MTPSGRMSLVTHRIDRNERRRVKVDILRTDSISITICKGGREDLINERDLERTTMKSEHAFRELPDNIARGNYTGKFINI